jgi:hypothetical protein
MTRPFLCHYMFHLAAGLLLAATLGILLTGCNLPRRGQALTPTGNFASTYAAQTVSALTTQFAQLPSATPPNGTPPTAPAATTPAPGITAAPPCDRAEFVSDVTVPDGSDFKPGEAFVKTWRLKNTGSCTWTTSYRVVFDSGNALGAPASFNLPVSVPPDALVDISVNMRAPDQPRAYESYWKLQNAQGITFGLGSDGQKAFWVKIEVIAPNTPAP